MLLDGILVSPQRVEALDRGVSDLIVCAADKLGAIGQIEKECSSLLWRLVGSQGSGRTVGVRRREVCCHVPAWLQALEAHRNPTEVKVACQWLTSGRPPVFLSCTNRTMLTWPCAVFDLVQVN